MYGDSLALSPNPTPIFSPTLEANKGKQVTKSKDFSMDSAENINFHDYKQYQNNPVNPGLLRFRSAPSSLLSSFTDELVKKSGTLTQEAQGLTSGFQDWEDDKSLVNNGYGLSSQLPPQYPRQNLGNQLNIVSSMGTDPQQVQEKRGSNLARKNSSPTGFFPYLISQNGYATMRGVGNYRAGNGANGDLSPPSSRLRGQMNLSSGVTSSFGTLNRITENESESIGGSGSDDGRLGNGDSDSQFSSFGYPFGSWNDSSQLTENFTGLKRELDSDVRLFPGTQHGELGNRLPLLSHHLSLPRTSAELAAMEKLLQFQDAVPCKIRAKRGCATHPRSIAERVRRTRISERMRKLQELVPNMDKQTNTADMLDLAVDYIKELQKQYKMLSDNRAKCKCSSTQRPVSNRTV